MQRVAAARCRRAASAALANSWATSTTSYLQPLHVRGRLQAQPVVGSRADPLPGAAAARRPAAMSSPGASHYHSRQSARQRCSGARRRDPTGSPLPSCFRRPQTSKRGSSAVCQVIPRQQASSPCRPPPPLLRGRRLLARLPGSRQQRRAISRRWMRRRTQTAMTLVRTRRATRPGLTRVRRSRRFARQAVRDQARSRHPAVLLTRRPSLPAACVCRPGGCRLGGDGRA